MKRSTKNTELGREVLTASQISEKIKTLEDAIWSEFASSLDRLALVGIQTRGAHLAHRLAAALAKRAGRTIPVGILDITLYRDDVHAIAEQPDVKETDLPFDLEDRAIVLIDDVLFTGRTVRSAMNALIDFGRPRCIRLAVLIDRGLRELPIGADYVGVKLATQPGDIVDVNLAETDDEENVRLREAGANAA